MFYNRTALVAALTTMHAPSAGDAAPSELFTVLGALGHLDPAATYVVYDQEQSAGTLVPSEAVLAQVAPQGTPLASWDGSAPGSFGYGHVELCTTPAGQGLLFSVGGSPASSAMTIYVVPVSAAWPAVNCLDDEVQTLAMPQ